MKRGDIITVEEIWRVSDNGRLVFESILGKISRGKIKSPFRDDGNTPAFSIFVGDNGIYLFKDFGGDGASGNAIDFVMKLYNKTFPEALKHIKSGIVGEKPVIITNKPKPIKKQSLLLEVEGCNWEQRHVDYWKKYGLPPSFLESKNIFPISKYAIEKKVTKIPSDVASFAYLHESGGIKILQIGENVTKKWINSCKNDVIWFLPKERCKQLWICKSVKDSLVMEYHFHKCSCAVQNEDYRHLDKRMPELLTLADEIVLNWGSDKMAVENCIILQQKYNTKYWNSPKYMLKFGIEDISDVIDQFGVEIAKKELKKKKFL